ncbi:MAG: MerR family transcriptional regulator [Acidobacteriales bacterium]|nr:MerR family transcriptional regulator [Terriglobales bacterium]
MTEPALELTNNDPEIPNKLYFRIGEVSRLVGVEPHVLRYWETEFAALKPKKGGTKQRLYRRKDVEIALEIKRLLYERRYTIEGARKHLEAKVEAPPPKPVRQAELFDPLRGTLEDVRRELRAILEMLK